MIRLPPLDELARRWFEVEPILKRATDYGHGCEEPIHLLQQVFANQGALWFVEDGGLIGVIMTRIDQRPLKRLFVISHIAGDHFEDWMPEMVELFSALQKERGCDAMIAYGRPGWKRFLESRGLAVHAATEVMMRS